MTASITNLIEKVRDAKRQLIANREADVLRISLDQIALVKLRIQTTGEDSTGGKFEPYTPIYAAKRKEKGLQVGFVDFTDRGRLWASIQPRIVASNVFSASVEIGPQNEGDAAKLRGLQGKRPNILQPSDQEIRLIKEQNRNRIQKYFKF
jgi:hypothetical protein